MSIKAITIDFWGTLLFDNPSSDNRYKGRRMKDFANVLAGAGLTVPVATPGILALTGTVPGMVQLPPPVELRVADVFWVALRLGLVRPMVS